MNNFNQQKILIPILIDKEKGNLIYIIFILH